MTALVAPWYVAASIAGGRDFAYDLIVRQNLLRFARPFDHREPFYFYSYVIITDFLPFSVFLPGAIVYALTHDREPDRTGRKFVLSWLIGGLVFFSLSASKREAYLLPLYPAAAIVVGSMLSAWINGEPMGRYYVAAPAWLWCAGLLTAGSIASALVAQPTRLKMLLAGEVATQIAGFASLRLIVIPFIAMAFLGAAAGSLALISRRPITFVASAAATMALAMIWTQQYVLPVLNPYKSARPAAIEAVALTGSDGLLAAYSPVPYTPWSDNFSSGTLTCFTREDQWRLSTMLRR